MHKNQATSEAFENCNHWIGTCVPLDILHNDAHADSRLVASGCLHHDGGITLLLEDFPLAGLLDHRLLLLPGLCQRYLSLGNLDLVPGAGLGG